ncbi:MAG: hypothetical protein HZA90_26205 [Verrucomicrobia bacterium]|nr:hypothetical protein [Verrucomicrobiota bacterium]
MSVQTNNAGANRLPDGFLALPIHAVSTDTPLRVCVLARRAPDPVAGHFVLLRDLPDAMVYLGCVTDAAGRLREWIELWVQNVDGLDASLPALREAFSNHTVDQRWAQQAESLAALDSAGALRTGWETKHPLPCFLDLAKAAPVNPGDDTHGPWELCQNDAALQAAGLPTYSFSLFRYLWQPKAAVGGKFVPVTAGAPANEKTFSLQEAVGGAAGHLPLNPQGGLLMATTFAPLSFEDYVDLLGGKPWKGLEQGRRPLVFDGVYQGLDDWTNIQQSGAHLFLGAKGRAGRFVETFHLKLQLLAEIVRAVRAVVERSQLPFLNLTADSFRVRLQPVGAQLPFLWTARAVLAKPGDAYALPVETTESRYFIRTRAEGASIYLPEGISMALQGSGSVRLRQVLSEQGRTIIEGTLVLQERQSFSQHDLFWIRLPLSSGRVDLYGHLYSAESLARGEVRFRTVGQIFSDAVAKALKAAEGASFPRSPFEVVPLLSSPCDLYALGVLATRALLVNEQNTLAVALDELLSLARQVGTEHDATQPLGQRVRAIVENEARFLGALGPHRLTREVMDPQQAFAFLPEELWFDTLGTLLRFFPGAGPDSACKDFGDVPALALESVFNAPLAELEKLLVRSRSLIVIDWNSNREVQAVIAGMAAAPK